MKLKFRIETRKIKQPRIVVLRLLNQENGKVIEKSLGSFNARRGYEHIIKQLNPEELYEFENFVKVIHFSKSNFNCNADRLDRFIIKSAPEFKEALFKIWAKAKDYAIDFTPEYEMLLFILNQAKSIEQQLSILTKGEFNALDALGIDISDFNPPKRDLKEDQKLLIAVIEHSNSLEELTKLFNDIASLKYHKTPKFKPHHFEYLVKQSVSSQKPSSPKWYYTVAIDVLCTLGVKPDTIISPALLTQHWLRLNKLEDWDKTLKSFNKQFPELKDHTLSMNIIKSSFVNDALSRMNQTPQTVPIPTLAVERWLKRWQEKNTKGDSKAALKTFNQEFPLFVDHPFFVKSIAKHFDAT